MQRVNADRLIRDLRAVAADVDELIKSTAGNANEAVIEARERVGRSLQIATLKLEIARLRAIEDARKARRSMDIFLRPHAWKAVGIAAGIGLLFGARVGLNAGSPRRRRVDAVE